VTLCIAGLTACTGIGMHFPWQKVPTATNAPVATGVPTVTEERVLTICLGKEPDSLYLYAEQQSTAMWSVLDAIYDGPFDFIGYTERPVILQKTPSFEDGDLAKTAVNVKAGDLVVDANNDLVILEQGTRFLPSGCGDLSCAVDWDGASEIQMDQLSVVFKLRSNLLWSDGTPMTMADSRYSFEVASDPATASAKNDIEHTATYDVVDDGTIKWTGVPGLKSPEIPGMFWNPLPRHILGEIPVSKLAESDLAVRQPLGWGPYVVNKWVIGESIELVQNANYYRASEGLPKFDRLVYRFINPASGGSLAALVAGQCDAVERSSNPQADISLVIDSVNSTKAKALWSNGPEILQLVFGIKPATYEDGYNAAIDRPDYFRNPMVRQALATCIDRQGIINRVFYGKAELASLADILGNQSNGKGGTPLEYDPIEGNHLLEQAGWIDMDNDPLTPRMAVNSQGIPDGTLFSLTLLSPEGEVFEAVASALAESLAGCGIEVKSETDQFDELYAPGPAGRIFGRDFDMALISWQYSQIPACTIYTTSQIPGQDNYWVGANIAGYSNTDFDVACSKLMNSLPGEAEYDLTLQRVEELFSQNPPSLPLILTPKVVLTRPDFCNFDFDPAARSDLINLELFDFNSQCVP
jgi:peptide/nickel transport system substrate-binding protein